MSFLLDPSEFSGPGQGIFNRGELDQWILPATDGDAIVTVNEERFDVAHDKTGNTKRGSFRLGQNLTITYPMKTADMHAFAFAVRGDPIVNHPPDEGSVLSPGYLDEKIMDKKEVYSFDLFRTAEPLFDAYGDPVPRTLDSDKFGLRLDHCIINPNGDAYKFNKGESVYSMQIEAILPSKTDTLYRFFNTDLALA